MQIVYHHLHYHGQNYGLATVASHLVHIQTETWTAISVVDLEFEKGGFMYAIKVHVTRLLREFGGMPTMKIWDF